MIGEDDGEAPSRVDAGLLEKWALAYLERYASSAENLRRVLRRRVIKRLGPDADEQALPLIAALVERYRAGGLLDDAAYAAARAESQLARGRSLYRIAAGLAAKGVDREDANAALDSLREAAAEPDLVAAANFARRRRLGPYRTAAPADRRERELAAFARAGFSRRIAELILACADESELAALLTDRP
jgi:regulatory protein